MSPHMFHAGDYSSSDGDSDLCDLLFGKAKKDKKKKYHGYLEHMQTSAFSHLHAYAEAQGYGLPSNPYGHRLLLNTNSAFPDVQHTLTPPCYDADGFSPVFFGSAIFESSVQPCKIGRHLQSTVSVPYGGGEHYHYGRYDLLPFIPAQMELVRTSYGKIPHGRCPVDGGYECNGAKLYHAIGVINGIRVPGKTGDHLGGCNVAFNGAEHVIQENYDILCWRHQQRPA